MSASSVDLTTIAALRAYMGATAFPDNPANNAVGQALITAYSRYAMTYCSRDFRLQSYDETYNGVAGQGLSLRQGPIRSVQQLTNGACVVQASASFTQWGYVISGDFMLYLRGLYFVRGPQSVNVQYTAGYFTPGQAQMVSPPDYAAVTVPEDLQESIIEAVSYKYKRIAEEDKSSLNISGNAGTTFINLPIPALTKAVWDNYKRALLWP